MECIQRLTHRLIPSTITGICFKTVTARSIRVNPLTHTRNPLLNPLNNPKPFNLIPGIRHQKSYSSSSSAARAGWFLGLKDKKKDMPDIVKAGDPVLHEPAREVTIEEIGSDRIQKIIDDMVKVMRNAPGVGLAAPQIGIPLKIVVLEDTKEYIGYASKEEVKEQDRRPFDLLVIINPQLRKKSNKSALFFEGCLR